MKVRTTSKGELLVFPEPNEFQPLKLWLNEYGDTDENYRDKTAKCYVIRSHSIADLKKFGFRVQTISDAQYKKLIRDMLEKGYELEDE